MRDISLALSFTLFPTPYLLLKSDYRELKKIYLFSIKNYEGKIIIRIFVAHLGR